VSTIDSWHKSPNKKNDTKVPSFTVIESATPQKIP